MTEATDVAVGKAKAVMMDYLDALNKRDSAALIRTMHFPHYRLSEGQLKTWAAADDYFADFKRRAGGDWHHTRWGHMEAVQSSAEKVHLDVRVDRYDAEDRLIVSFRSLWVIALIDDRWGAQLRSSFAPDSRFATTQLQEQK